VQLRRARQIQPVLASIRSGGVAVLLCASLASITSLGCWQPMQHSRIVPAARGLGDERVMALLPITGPEVMGETYAVVRVVTKDHVTCTGTLIADDRVLTAHHCLSARDKRGHIVDHDVSPEDVTVELGPDYLFEGEVKPRAIVAPQCGYVSGEGDIAILVLSRRIVGYPTATVREAPPSTTDEVHPLGFGSCSSSKEGIHVETREADKVNAVSHGYFAARAAICPGDSGGPVYDHAAKGNIIGVISASVMDGTLDKDGERVRTHSLFTRVDVWPQLFSAAHEISGGASPSELPPYGECHVADPARPARPAARP
jgi:hypothetical protein